MASKKSAASKGYRKTVKKQPYLTKKEIILSCCIVAALILVVVLFNVFYSDGSLKLVDGVPQTTQENPLLLNAGTGNNPRYYQAGHLSEVEGYTLEATASASDENIQSYSYTPEGGSAVDSITVTAANGKADASVEYAHTYYGAYGFYQLGDVYSKTFGDTTAWLLSLKTDPEALAEALAEAEAAIPDSASQAVIAESADAAIAESADQAVENVIPESSDEAVEGGESDAPECVQVMYAYVPAGDYCVVYQAVNEAASTEEYVEDAVLEEALGNVLQGLTVDLK